MLVVTEEVTQAYTTRNQKLHGIGHSQIWRNCHSLLSLHFQKLHTYTNIARSHMTSNTQSHWLLAMTSPSKNGLDWSNCSLTRCTSALLLVTPATYCMTSLEASAGVNQPGMCVCLDMHVCSMLTYHRA